MHTQTIFAAVMALFAGLGSALPANTIFYATFYDDTACTQNPGEAVAVENPGCLNESGRNSIYFQDAFNYESYFSLVVSPTPDCPCQSDCVEAIVNDPTGTQTPFCFDLSHDSTAQSFRFISGDCSSNNC